MPVVTNYLNIRVIIGQDSHTFAILAKVNEALKDAGVSEEERAEFRRQCWGSTPHLLQTILLWVRVE
jgi:hypothetical protein